MTTELRCGPKKFGELDSDHQLIVKCDSKFCGAKSGVVVLHVFNVQTGQLVRTNKYKEIGANHDAK